MIELAPSHLHSLPNRPECGWIKTNFLSTHTQRASISFRETTFAAAKADTVTPNVDAQTSMNQIRDAAEQRNLNQALEAVVNLFYTTKEEPLSPEDLAANLAFCLEEKLKPAQGKADPWSHFWKLCFRQCTRPEQLAVYLQKTAKRFGSNDIPQIDSHHALDEKEWDWFRHRMATLLRKGDRAQEYTCLNPKASPVYGLATWKDNLETKGVFDGSWKTLDHFAGLKSDHYFARRPLHEVSERKAPITDDAFYEGSQALLDFADQFCAPITLSRGMIDTGWVSLCKVVRPTDRDNNPLIDLPSEDSTTRRLEASYQGDDQASEYTHFKQLKSVLDTLESPLQQALLIRRIIPSLLKEINWWNEPIAGQKELAQTYGCTIANISHHNKIVHAQFTNLRDELSSLNHCQLSELIKEILLAFQDGLPWQLLEDQANDHSEGSDHAK